MGSGGVSNQGSVDDIIETSNGGGILKPWGDVIDLEAAVRLTFRLIVVNAPESGTCQVTIQESPDHEQLGETAHWYDLHDFTAIDKDSPSTLAQKYSVPNNTDFTTERFIRIASVNSASGQTCRYSVYWRGV